ncbi:MAG: FtsX-like permease family protein [Lachnospiraceae bacterium]|nr:FtsX-like permease family protein [Lachnospiraceae bacterium]
MLTANRFALQRINHQRFRSLIFFFLVFIASTCIFGTDVFMENMESGVKHAENKIGADIIVVPSDYSDDAKEVLFEGNACTILFQNSPVEKIKTVEGVKHVSEQLYLKTLKMDCCSAAGVQIIAIDIHSDFAVGEWLKNKGIEKLGEDELIVGSDCGLQVDEKIGFYDRIFTVAAVLEETGMGYDESAFISFEAANKITANPQYKELFHEKTGLSSMVLIDVDERYETDTVQKNIINISYNDGVSVYSTSRLAEKLVRQVNYFHCLSYIMNAFVILLATVALFSLITVSFHQRRNQVGSLLSVGIGKKKIMQVFLIEYIYLMLAGIVSGIILTIVFLLPLHSVIKQTLHLPYIFIGFYRIAFLSFKTIGINFAILLLALSFSFYQIMKLEPAILAEEQV